MPDTEASRLLPSERQQRIRQLAVQQGVLRIPELAETFSVSEMTIRRDLELLEQSGHIERTFGGALVIEQTFEAGYQSSYQQRLNMQIAQKEAIARYATTLVKDGDTLALDSSTTVLPLAKELAKRNVTIITNGLDCAQALRSGQAKVILTGGYLRQVAGNFAGPLALKSLEGLRVNHTFFSAEGVLIPDGYLNSDLDEIEVKRRMVAAAQHVTALIDSSKFGVHALGQIASLDAVHLLITDSGLDAKTQTLLRKHKIKTKVVKV